MGTLIKQKKHYFTRLPLVLFLLGLIGGGPMIVAVIGIWATETFTGQTCTPMNSCTWCFVPWLMGLTFPVAMVGVLLLIFIVLRDSVSLFNKK